MIAVRWITLNTWLVVLLNVCGKEVKMFAVAPGEGGTKSAPLGV